MTLRFDLDSLRHCSRQLSSRARTAFILSCGERLLPNYRAFCRHHDWGDEEVLRKALDLGWDYLRGETINQTTVGSLRIHCESVTPDTNDFDSIYVSPALDAGVVVLSLIDSILDPDRRGPFLDAATLARDTVDMYVQGINDLDPQDPALEERILRHPLMQSELMRQKRDLKQLELASRTSLTDAAARLEMQWRSPKVSSLGLG